MRCLVAQEDRLPPVTVDPLPAASASQPASVVDEPVLAVDGVSKAYRIRRGRRTSTVDAVRDVSFDLHRGRVTALVGQSGSGKTTIARLVTGVERPSAGSVVFAGGVRVDQVRGRGLRDYRRRVQMVFQDRSAP